MFSEQYYKKEIKFYSRAVIFHLIFGGILIACFAVGVYRGMDSQYITSIAFILFQAILVWFSLRSRRMHKESLEKYHGDQKTGKHL